MFREYLSDKQFPIKEFVQELDKRELLFFVFISSEKAPGYILERSVNPEDIDHFYKTAQRLVGSSFKKLTRERLVEDMTALLEGNIPNTLVYSSIYDYNYSKDFGMLNKQLLAIERFVTMQFLKKIKRVVEVSEERSIKNGKELEDLYLYEHRPILNTLGLTMLISKIDSIYEDKQKPISMNELRDSLTLIFYKQFLNRETKNRLHAEEMWRRKDLLMERIEKEATKKEELFKKTKEKCSELTKDLKDLQKETNHKIQEAQKQIDFEKEKKYKEEFSRLEKIIESLKQELKSQQELWEKRLKESSFNLENEINLLKEKEKEYLSEISQYKRKVNAMESKTLETTLKEYLREHEFPEEVRTLLRERLEQEESHANEGVSKPETGHRIEQRIGYCQIQDDKHFVTFANGEKFEIQDIPESTYIGENQFVKVDVNGKFKYVFSARYVPSDRDYQIVEFGSIIYKNSEPVMIKAVWDERQIKNLPSRIRLRESQVISINGRGELVRFYGSVQHNADTYLPSIRAKGHEAYYVMKLFPNGLMLRSLLTEEETFQTLDFNGYSVKEQEILCVDDNQIVHVYRSPRFYTMSSHYKRSETGVAEIQDDTVFVRKLSGEIVIVNDIPPSMTISDGETLVVDENANFITIKNDRRFDKPVERKRLEVAKPNLKKRNERIEVEKELLIVGNISYENSYKMAFYKKGYRAQVIDGFEPWSRIRSSLKDKDAVVVVSDFISHDNMYRLKEEGLGIPLLFPEHDGANRILEEVHAKFEGDTI